MIRVGYSKDIHRLKKGKQLILGGIEIDSPYETIAHSDGDVLLHALCEALLGAKALGDLGTHFPNTDDAYKNIDSKLLLKRVYDMILKQGYKIINIDTMVILEAPKLKPHIIKMQKTIAQILNLSMDDISIKATTFEGLDDGGKHLKIEAHASVLIQKEATIKKL